MLSSLLMCQKSEQNWDLFHVYWKLAIKSKYLIAWLQRYYFVLRHFWQSSHAHFVLLCLRNIQEGRKQWSNYRKVAECINIQQNNRHHTVAAQGLALLFKINTKRAIIWFKHVVWFHSLPSYELFLMPVSVSFILHLSHSHTHAQTHRVLDRHS